MEVCPSEPCSNYSEVYAILILEISLGCENFQPSQDSVIGLRFARPWSTLNFLLRANQSRIVFPRHVPYMGGGGRKLFKLVGTGRVPQSGHAIFSSTALHRTNSGTSSCFPTIGAKPGVFLNIRKAMEPTTLVMRRKAEIPGTSRSSSITRRKRIQKSHAQHTFVTASPAHNGTQMRIATLTH